MFLHVKNHWHDAVVFKNHSIPCCGFLHRLAPAQPRKRRSRDARCETTLRAWENKCIYEVGVPWPARPIRRTRFPDTRTCVKNHWHPHAVVFHTNVKNHWHWYASGFLHECKNHWHGDASGFLQGHGDPTGIGGDAVDFYM